VSEWVREYTSLAWHSNASIHARQLSKSIKKPKKVDGIKHAIWSSMISKTWWASVLFSLGVITGTILFIYGNNGWTATTKANLYAMNGFLYTFGCFVFVFLVFDAKKKSLKLDDRITEKLCVWAQKKQGSSTEEMDVFQLGDVLERSSVFLPPSRLKSVFDSIDDDNSGLLTLDEIKGFASQYEKRGPLKGSRLILATLQRCFKSVSFYMSWGYVIGSILFTVAAYRPRHARHLYGVGSLLYLIGSLNGTKMCIQAACGALKNKRDLQQTILKRFGGGINTSAADFKEEGARVFRSMDTGDSGGDSQIDVVELYDAFHRAGIVIDFETLRIVFNDLDSSGDGLISLDEFLQYIEQLRNNVSCHDDDVWKVLNSLFWDIHFWNSLFAVIGGALYTAGSWTLKASWTGVSRMFQVGRIFYWWCTLYYARLEFQGYVNSYNISAGAKYQFKEEFFKMILESEKSDDKDSIVDIDAFDTSSESILNELSFHALEVDKRVQAVDDSNMILPV